MLAKIEKGNRKTINGWVMYDWANSVYSLVITSAIFPVYYAGVTTTNGSDIVSLFGFHFINTALYSFVISASFLIIAILSPLLSGIADYSGNKKKFMQFFCYLGSAACIGLAFFDANDLWWGLLCLLLASIGYSGSLVFYNAYLPEIAATENQDQVSAKGYAMGYIGSSLLLIFNLLMIMKPTWFFLPENSALPALISFVTVGLWWAGFAQITFKRLPDNVYNFGNRENRFTKGYSELLKVWKDLRGQKRLKRFLTAFFVYAMGVQTVMYMAVLFGEKEVQMTSSQLIITVLLIQFVAIGGAYLFSFLSKKFSNIKALIIAVIVWIAICIGAYFVYYASQFYIVAAAVGIVMGGIQALSRSTYSKFLPETIDHASYFSFFDVCEKVGIVIGTFAYGYIEEVTGSMRNSVFVLALFFVVGLILLLRIPKEEKINLKFDK